MLLGVLTRTEISNEQRFGVPRANKWRAMQAYFNERAHFDHIGRAPSWIQIRERLGEREKAT